MSVLNKLEPRNVWTYFEELTKVPRPSKKEEKVIKFLMDFAEKNNIEAKRDATGNILMKKPAYKGMENLKSVILQSHMDMVCEANKDVNIDFDNDPITPYIDGEWVKARGTTLGADDGIGVAAQMAILTDNKIKHGPLECLFTVDEETGLTGAFGIEPNFFESKILLNLDSEDEGEIFIGCAGGIDTVATFSFTQMETPKRHKAFKFTVNGLTGGHSGDEIHKGFGNSNKIANRFLFLITDKYDARLSTFDGGNKRNAIPREAEFIFTIDNSLIEELYKDFEIFKKDITKEIIAIEKNINISLTEEKEPDFVIDSKAQRNFILAVYACPHGVHAWSPEIQGLVETSTNLASIKFSDNNIIISTSQRSSLESGKQDINTMVRSVFALAGAKTTSEEEYPGWAPSTNSEILTIAAKSYERLFGKSPIIRAIHAGLECGLFLEKYPELDMISFGPTLRGVHAPEERIEIKTVRMWYDHLLDILKNIPKV